MKSPVHRDTAIGLLTLQLGWADRQQVMAAAEAADDRSLEQALVEQGVLQTPQAAVLAQWFSHPGPSSETSTECARPLRQDDQEVERLQSWFRDRNANLTETDDHRFLTQQPPTGKDPRDPFATLQPSGDRGTGPDRIQSPHRNQQRDSIQGLDTRSESSRFQPLRPLARGGLGEVFVAEDLELHRNVALKRMQKHLSGQGDARRRFLFEAELTGRLEHPGIVPIYGLGRNRDGEPFYAMRLIRGETLQQAIQQFHAPAADRDPGARTLALRQLLDRFVDVCQTVEYAHHCGVLHRDIKPDNVMLGPYGETLLVDWGLAKWLGDDSEPSEGAPVAATIRDLDSRLHATHQGSLVGTPAYMSPEQARGDSQGISPRSDVYALGGLLYAILTGKPPVDASSLRPQEGITELLRRVADGDIPAAHRVDRSVARALSAICAKAMEHSPEQRYASAVALADDVTRFLADEPVEAYPDPVTVRIWRWVRRHQALAASSIVLLLATALFLAVVLKVVRTNQEALRIANRDLETANQRAVQAAEESELRRQQAEQAKANEFAFSDFLVNHILASAHPQGQAGGLGINVSVVDALTTAEDQIEQVFAELPLAEATTRSGLGDTWQLLSDYPRAITQHRRASEILRQQLGPTDIEYLTSLSSLATALKYNGQLDQAVDLQQRVLQEMQSTLAPEDDHLLIAKNNLALSYGSEGRIDLGIQMLREVMQQTREQLGPRAPETLNAIDNLAALLRQGDELQQTQALEMYRNLVPLKREVLGDTHPETLSAINNLATFMLDRGETEAGIAQLRSTLDQMHRQLGPAHADTLTTATNLAFAQASAGQADQAIDSLEAVIDACRTNLGPAHPSTLNALDILASIQADRGNLPEAIRLYEQVVPGRAEALGVHHPETLTSNNNLALAYQNMGRTEEAIPRFESILDYRRQHLDADHPRFYVSLNNLAAAKAQHGDLAEASALYKELAGLLEESGDPLEYLRVQHNLADTLFRSGRAEQAAELFEQQLQRLKAMPEAAPMLWSLTRQGLAVACLEIDRSARAAELLQPMVEEQRTIAEASKDPAARSTLRGLLVYLCEAELGLQHFGKAEEAARESLTIARELMPEDWRRYNAQSLLGESLLGQNRLDEAEELLPEAHTGLLANRDSIPPVMADASIAGSYRRMIDLRSRQGDQESVEQLRSEWQPKGEQR